MSIKTKLMFVENSFWTEKYSFNQGIPRGNKFSYSRKTKALNGAFLKTTQRYWSNKND